MMITERFEEALLYATRIHATQMRKGGEIPYISHLMGVTALVLENGGDEDQAIAALLHDAVEDQGGLRTLEDIRHLFGEHVSAIVEGCTDAFVIPKPPWRKRKEDYLNHLRNTTQDIRLVSLADNLNNARSLLRSTRIDGESVWLRFNGGKDGTLWYYQSILQIFKSTGSDFMTDELERVISQILEIENIKK